MIHASMKRYISRSCDPIVMWPPAIAANLSPLPLYLLFDSLPFVKGARLGQTISELLQIAEDEDGPM